MPSVGISGSVPLEPRGISLQGSHLFAEIPNASGQYVHAQIDLDQILGVDGGNFQWGGVNFSQSATMPGVDLEGEAKAPILRAGLTLPGGVLGLAEVKLAERIVNVNGTLVFQ